jgi:hypothetical protein
LWVLDWREWRVTGKRWRRPKPPPKSKLHDEADRRNDKRLKPDPAAADKENVKNIFDRQNQVPAPLTPYTLEGASHSASRAAPSARRGCAPRTLCLATLCLMVLRNILLHNILLLNPTVCGGLRRTGG